MTCSRFVLLLATAALLFAGAVPTSAQTADDLFDAGTLQEIRLMINTRDLALLRQHWDQNTKYPADLIWRGIRVRNISVRAHGGIGSRNPIKISFNLEFDQYTKGQRFLGLRSLVLRNEWADRSLIRDQVSMAFFNRMGLPASRESFGRVYINNEYQGLYGVTEAIDQEYLTRTLGQNSGYLFEFHRVDFWLGNDLGDDLAAYKPRFEPRTRVLESDTQLYGPIRDLFREVNLPDDAVWRERVERLIDLRQFVTFVAIEVFLSEADGVTGDHSMNNFYVYRPADSNVHVFLPWDRDLSMSQTTGDSSIFTRVDDNVLFHRATAYADLRELYLNVLEACAQAALQDDWFQNAVALSAAVTTEAAHADTKKQFTNDDYEAGIRALMEFATLRSAFVLEDVARTRSLR